MEYESQQVTRFIGGLSEEIQEKLEMSSIWSLNEAVNLAFKGEKQVMQSASRSTTRRHTASNVTRSGYSTSSLAQTMKTAKGPSSSQQ